MLLPFTVQTLYPARHAIRSAVATTSDCRRGDSVASSLSYAKGASTNYDKRVGNVRNVNLDPVNIQWIYRGYPVNL